MLDALRVHLDQLAERGLVIWLSPPAAQADADDDPRPIRVEPPRSIAPVAGAELESRIGDLERAVAALRERLQGLEDALGGSGS